MQGKYDGKISLLRVWPRQMIDLSLIYILVEIWTCSHCCSTFQHTQQYQSRIQVATISYHHVHLSTVRAKKMDQGQQFYRQKEGFYIRCFLFLVAFLMKVIMATSQSTPNMPTQLTLVLVYLQPTRVCRETPVKLQFSTTKRNQKSNFYHQYPQYLYCIYVFNRINVY